MALIFGIKLPYGAQWSLTGVNMSTARWVSAIPGLAVFLVVLAGNFVAT